MGSCTYLIGGCTTPPVLGEHPLYGVEVVLEPDG
jgi:hypothetical protein